MPKPTVPVADMEDASVEGTTSRIEDNKPSGGQPSKRSVWEPGFVEEHKRKANGWIKETTPKNVFLPRNKRAGWVVMRNEERERRRIRSTAMREMPTLPFDLWCMMKEEEERAEDTKKATKDEKEQRRKHYMRLGADRKLNLFGGSKSVGHPKRASAGSAPPTTRKSVVSVKAAD